MEFGKTEDPDKSTKTNSSSNTSAKKLNGQMKTLNNFFTMADAETQQNKDKEVSCIICEGKHHVFKCKMEGVTPKIARERVMKAGACINCLDTDHYILKCKAGGCRIGGCGKLQNTRLHDPEIHGPVKKMKSKQ